MKTSTDRHKHSLQLSLTECLIQGYINIGVWMQEAWVILTMMHYSRLNFQLDPAAVLILSVLGVHSSVFLLVM